MKFKKIFDELRKSKKAKKAIKVKKSMLLLKSKYDWKAMHGDNRIRRELDSKIFNRKQGYEVKWMIQEVVNHFVYTTESDVQKVEDIIANKLPGNVRSQKNVFDWLVNYLSKR